MLWRLLKRDNSEMPVRSRIKRSRDVGQTGYESHLPAPIAQCDLESGRVFVLRWVWRGRPEMARVHVFAVVVCIAQKYPEKKFQNNELARNG